MKFSERYGYKPVKETIQIESIDEPLRNGLWSLLKLHCWDKAQRDPSNPFGLGGMGGGMGGGIGSGGTYCFLDSSCNKEIQILCQRLWLDYFKKPLDELDNHWAMVLDWLRKYFFSCQWYEVYDFIEFVVDNYKQDKFRDTFMPACNRLLEKEISAYRFVDGVITRITEEQEISEIEQAIEASGEPASKHLHRSLELLSDRENPDYRNSIKESISAVESLVAIVLKANGTLGQLIKKLETEIKLHPALKTAFISLYGYTSDEGGIRHALTESAKVDFNDAKFMLVICSAFINFVKGKTQNSVA